MKTLYRVVIGSKDSNVECAFLWHNQSLCDSDLACEKNSVVYVEVPEKEK